MPAYYVYLISSLPMLHFGMKPPFSFEKFISICLGLLPEKDVALLQEPSTFKEWQSFDIALRNELVKIRSSRKHLEATKYLRGDEYIEPFISHIARNASRNASILEAERMLDEERWRFLDNLSLGHFFDLDFLLTYALKLLILERWGRINSADKPRLLDEVLQEKI